MKSFCILLFSLCLTSISYAQATAENNNTKKTKKEVVKTSSNKAKAMSSYEGVNQLNKILQEELILPAIVKDAGIEGKVIVRVDLDKTGTIVKATIKKGLEESVDASILKLLNQVESVQPIIIKGKPTAKAIELTVHVKL